MVVRTEIKAFPSAVGAGYNTLGGSGGIVVHVTNLNDSGTGSLRWALTDNTLKTQDRTIVFDISGVIQLSTVIRMDSSHTGGITIAGFTAPYGGITVIGQMVRMTEANSVIVRNMRFRGGYNDTDPNNAYSKSTFLMGRTKGFIVDHCSISFAKEQGMGGNGGDTTSNIYNGSTWQNNLVNDVGRVGIIGQGITSSAASRLDNMQVTVYNQVMVDVGWRQPNISGNIRMDLINNFVHNWAKQLSNFGATYYADDPTRDEITKTNAIGNYYQDGGTTRLSSGDNYPDPLYRLFKVNDNNDTPQFYWEDNYISDYFNLPNYPAQPETAFRPYTQDGSSATPQNSWFQYPKFTMNGITPVIISSQDIKTEVFPTVGACYYTDDNGDVQYYRDNIDTEAIRRATVKSDALKGRDEFGVVLPSYQDRAEALLPNGSDPMPSFTRPANFYQSNPHIPEAWLVAKGLTGTATIHNELAPSGYTWMEEYINQVDNLSTPSNTLYDISTAFRNSGSRGLIKGISRGTF